MKALDHGEGAENPHGAAAHGEQAGEDSVPGGAGAKLLVALLPPDAAPLLGMCSASAT